MKNYLKTTLCCGLLSVGLLAQQDTEVYLTDIMAQNEELSFGVPKIISNNKGYNNQPSFYNNDGLLFATTRNNQTDIAKYDIRTDAIKWLSDTNNGSEYSPTKIPNVASFSSIRLDTDGLQRLYSYPVEGGDSKILVADAKIGYHVWYSETILVATVLVDNRMDLVVYNLEKKTSKVLQENVGRSLHKIPNTELVSFISVDNDSLVVKSIHPISGIQKTFITLPQGTQDICWSPDGSILTGLDNYLMRFNPKTDTEWKDIFQFSDTDIYSISRLAVSPDGKKLALVSAPSPAKIVQKQVESFNARDLDAFVNCYTSEVLVTNFPSDTISVGREQMKEGYATYYERTPSIEVKVSNRITIGATVIDHEVVTINDQQNLQVAIYEVDGLIKSMRFIHDKKVETDPEIIVQKQLDAYNARDIDGFLATYTDDIKLYNFPNMLRTEGIAAMRKGYGGYFENTPDLHADIKNRIVIGNIVIDEEFVTANGNTFSAVAIYEVENGKIAKVTFIR
jgi:hypothetical protein